MCAKGDACSSSETVLGCGCAVGIVLVLCLVMVGALLRLHLS